MKTKTSNGLDSLLEIMDKLLGEDGCPWDKEQTHESLRDNLLEECHETIEAIDNKDMTSLKEELGDVLLQVVFHAKLAEKAQAFTIDDVVATISNKLITRHTHVFGDEKATTAEDALQIWKANKQKEQKLWKIWCILRKIVNLSDFLSIIAENSLTNVNYQFITM